MPSRESRPAITKARATSTASSEKVFSGSTRMAWRRAWLNIIPKSADCSCRRVWRQICRWGHRQLQRSDRLANIFERDVARQVCRTDFGRNDETNLSALELFVEGNRLEDFFARKFLRQTRW